MPVNDHVLSERISIPTRAGLRRRRLVEPLLAAAGPRLGLVVAPGGCGKTTLLSQVAAASDVPVAWYSASGNDVTEVALARYLTSALARAIGLSTPTGADIVEVVAALDGSSAQEALLVVDDVHEIAGTGAERALEQFVAMRPRSLRVLLGSRRPPAMNLSRMRVSGEITELGTEDLRFRSWEVEQLFVDVYGEPLPPEAAATLARRTGGWAAGLQMFYLSTAGKPAPQRRQAVADLGGSSRLVRSYLARNVLAELAPERRSFLIRTSALGVLTGPLCDDLLDRSHSAQVLEELERDQLFTSSDDDGRSFGYHQVLQTYLEAALLDELGHDGTRVWYARSARLLEAAGFIREAERAYAHADDWVSVARLVRQAGGDSAATELMPALQAVLPARVWEQDPWLALAEARRLVRHGSLHRAVAAYRNARTLLTDPAFTQSCQVEESRVRVWLPRPDGSPTAHLDRRARRRHWTEQLRAATRGLPPLGETSAFGTDGALTDGLAALLAGRLREARPLLEAASADSTASATERIGAVVGLGVVDLVSGDRAQVAGRVEEVTALASADGHVWLARTARAVLEVALFAGGLTPWRDTGSQAYLAECEREGDEWGAALLLSIVGAATALLGSGDTTDLSSAAARFQRLDAPVLELWADALIAMSSATHAGRDADSREMNDAFPEKALRSIERRARRADVAGVRAIACAILGRDGGAADAAEMSQQAGELERSCGFNVPRAVASAHSPTEKDHPRSVVELRCFGGFRLEVDGREAKFEDVRPRALELLRLLSMRAGTDVHRERLGEALWPGRSTIAGTRSLQVAVSSLRRALDLAGLDGASVLRRRGDAYGVVLPDGSRADVRDLEQGLAAAAAAKGRGDLVGAVHARGAALSLYTGELLPEAGPAEWVVDERERLRLTVAAAALEQARDQGERGELPDAIAWASRSLQVDAYSDRSWLLLAELQGRSGDATAAARTRDLHRSVSRELVGADLLTGSGAGRSGAR